MFERLPQAMRPLGVTITLVVMFWLTLVKAIDHTNGYDVGEETVGGIVVALNEFKVRIPTYV